jgi:hypothetical protein
VAGGFPRFDESYRGNNEAFKNKFLGGRTAINSFGPGILPFDLEKTQYY